jgi:hypothetical protein
MAATKPEASSVIEQAIEEMRQHPQASSAADAIEGACGGRSFNVEAAVKGIEPSKTPTEEES